MGPKKLVFEEFQFRQHWLAHLKNGNLKPSSYILFCFMNLKKWSTFSDVSAGIHSAIRLFLTYHYAKIWSPNIFLSIKKLAIYERLWNSAVSHSYNMSNPSQLWLYK